MPNQSTDLREAAERACARIAPTWPLDRFIAVNPFWSCTDTPLPQLAAELASLSGARLLMPRAWYAQEWREGGLRTEHLRQAIAESGSAVTEDQLTALFWIPESTTPRRPLAVDVMDALFQRELEVSWREFIVERVSRFCAAYFDDGQAQIGPVRTGGLYASWREGAKGDRGPSLFMGLTAYRETAAALPTTADEMMQLAAAELGVPAHELDNYLWALLLDVNGWASWCAYLRWTARLENRDDNNILELLAIRLAWEWIVLRAFGAELRAEWQQAMASWPLLDRAARQARAEDWILQRAVEIAWTSQVRAQLLGRGFAAAPQASPTVQAAFCIDVRSEIFRRALEAQGPDVQTLGCAGFFGLPIEYAPLAADSARPQLPGLLPPKYRVTDTGAPTGLEATRRGRLQASQAWKAFKSTALSSFAFVDAMGLFFAADVFGESLGRKARPTAEHERAGLKPAEAAARTPRITSSVDGSPVAPEERCRLAEGILRTMGLTRGFAPLVLLIGHGAATRNNPYAAGLDCGACCGQPGEVNARAAADLLNDAEVRVGLVGRGIEIPETTRFVAGLHNTTTDEVVLFEDGAAATHARQLQELRAKLDRAGFAARRERAPKLGLGDLPDAELRTTLVERSLNWAEVRPEWGLAGNATFIVAPRERTRHVDLAGRAFLHDYRFEDDADLTILGAIMAGPVLVTHWINFQYYASTVDNRRYGSGNKVLHNVVGGHLGVFEGNGGDLRIGLSFQSLNDGERWIHPPLRLSVFIEAPRTAIDQVLEQQSKALELVNNEWIHLFQIDAATRTVSMRRPVGWDEGPAARLGSEKTSQT